MLRMAFASPFHILSLERIGSFHVRDSDIQFVLSGSFDGNNSRVSFFLLLNFCCWKWWIHGSFDEIRTQSFPTPQHFRPLRRSSYIQILPLPTQTGWNTGPIMSWFSLTHTSALFSAQGTNQLFIWLFLLLFLLFRHSDRRQNSQSVCGSSRRLTPGRPFDEEGWEWKTH